MTDDLKPITPTRIIPAGTPLPARPPEPTEMPPWRPPPPPAPPAEPPSVPPSWWLPPPNPGPIEVRVTFAAVVTDPEPTRWERLAGWLSRFGRPWQYIAALVLAVLPIPGVGYGVATTWHYTVGEARSSFGIGWAYAIAAIPLAWVATRLARRGPTFLRILGVVVAAFGLLGAMSIWDPISLITGVRP